MQFHVVGRAPHPEDGGQLSPEAPSGAAGARWDTSVTQLMTNVTISADGAGAGAWGGGKGRQGTIGQGVRPHRSSVATVCLWTGEHRLAALFKNSFYLVINHNSHYLVTH